MINPPPPRMQAPIRRRLFLALGALVLLGGCGTSNGDFGEVQPYLVRDDIHDWMGPYASTGSISKFALTDDERQMRDLAYPLVEPPYNRQQWYSIAGEYGAVRPDRATFDHTTYAARLLASRTHSPAARYAQLSDDIHNDMTRMPQFFETAGRVLDMDAKRQKSLAYVSGLSPAELKNTQARIRQNDSIVALVRAKLMQRSASYRFALERLVIQSPSPMAVDIERAITAMNTEIARYGQPAPSWVREQNLVTIR
jgi:hypothetical protein